MAEEFHCAVDARFQPGAALCGLKECGESGTGTRLPRRLKNVAYLGSSTDNRVLV